MRKSLRFEHFAALVAQFGLAQALANQDDREKQARAQEIFMELLANIRTEDLAGSWGNSPSAPDSLRRSTRSRSRNIRA